ncbi:copper resistance CopC family protein [Citricoccus alkalitolerans]|uniref:Copper resistance protein CopC n=1 Tax=Citricoccus alkalitolerans TaxID=246603 RepID=A0ABV8XWW9_9MICC
MNTHRTTPARHPGTQRTQRARGFGASTAALSAAALLALAMATPAAAHDQLLSAEPAAGTAVLEAPAEIGLEFSGNLTTGQGIQNLVTVTDEAGHQWQDGEAQVTGPSLTAALCEGLPNGEYTVDYRVVYSDGHSEEKGYEFTLEDPAAPESGIPEDCGVPNPDAPVSSDTTPGDAGTGAAGSGVATDGAGSTAGAGGAADARDSATTAATAEPGTAAADPATGEATAEDSQAPAGPVAGWVWPAAIGGVLVVVIAMLLVFRKARAIDTGSTGPTSRPDGAGGADGPDGDAGADGGSSGTGTNGR